MRTLNGAIILGLVLAGAAASAAAMPAPAAFQAKLGDIVRDGAPGVTAMVFKDGRLLYRAEAGTVAPDQVLPIASASKWMTAALVMTVVDEGKLSLDEPIGRRLPEFTGAAGQITLRQLMSFTAGQGGLEPDMSDLRQDPYISLADSARLVAARPLQDPPGAVFRYGGPSLQVAGALVEQATGKPWAVLFDERIAGPLGMSHTHWGNPLRPGLAPAEVRNPNLQAGVYTTADDYAAFLGMLAAGGEAHGRRILSRTAFEAMETLQTGRATMAYKPPGAAGLAGYALGNWCETWAEGGAQAGRCEMVSSPGAFGTWPWIDRKSGLYGLFFLKSRLPLVAKDITEARAAAVAADAR